MVFQRFRELLAGRTRTHHECRNCGTVLDEPAEECPACGASEIASYDL
ncbi:rubredoxin-like domain-containing protein [Halobacterium yunchengense]